MFVVSSARLQYSCLDTQTSGLLARLLRAPQLESRIVSEEGRPLERPAEPLRWQLLPAAEGEEDYRIRLLQADGTPPQGFLCILPGQPALYVTRQMVFAGPSQENRVLDPAWENRI